MQHSDLIARLAAAEKLAREAGALAREHLERGFEVKLKEDQSLVTVADGAVEAFLKERLAAQFPGDGFFGEETGGAIDGPTWIVDPIDGTANYAGDRPFWCVSIGLYADGAPALGVVYDPLRDELFHGLASGPAMMNGAALPKRAPVALDPHAAFGFGMRAGEEGRQTAELIWRIKNVGATVRIFGAGALMLCWVASGRLDAYFEQKLNIWDAAAALALLEAVGATWSGPFDVTRPSEQVEVVAAAPGLYEEFQSLRVAARRT